MSLPPPRAVGVRRRYDEVPDHVRAWVDDVLGSPVVETAEQVGGMSPGCATRVRSAAGRRAFVKVVGPELNPMTPDLFRREAYALSLLGDHPLWASLRAAYDEPGGWVALVLEDVPGRRPDLSQDAEMDRLVAATDELAEVLRSRAPHLAERPRGVDLLTTRDVVLRWRDGLARALESDEDVLPGWVVERGDELLDRSGGLAALAGPEQLVHWDVRDDNVLVRDNGSMVFVDWGGASRGPAWADPLMARLERVDSPWFDASVAGSPALAQLGDEHVTTFLAAIGGFLAWRAAVAVDVNLPTLNDFRRRESARFLAGARRRLAAEAGG